MPDLEDMDVVSVECGGMHTAVVTKDGKVRTTSIDRSLSGGVRAYFRT